jgi:hypothetical protein
MQHGADLERRLEIEVARHAEENPLGFAVRLHVLGDFYSVEYVGLWRQLVEQHSALHVWGYIPRAMMSQTIRSPRRWWRWHNSIRTVSQCAFRMRPSARIRAVRRSPDHDIR